MYEFLLLQISRIYQLLDRLFFSYKNKKTKKNKGNKPFFFLQNHLRLTVLLLPGIIPRPVGTNPVLNIIARNKRDCFLAFVLEVHFEKTRLVFLFRTE